MLFSQKFVGEAKRLKGIASVQVDNDFFDDLCKVRVKARKTFQRVDDKIIQWRALAFEKVDNL